MTLLEEMHEDLQQLYDEEYEADCDNGAPQSLRHAIYRLEREIAELEKEEQ